MLADLLHPTRFTAMSPRMAAIVGCILGEEWTDPSIHHITVTSDGFATCMHYFLGSVDDLVHNLAQLADAAQLDDVQRESFQVLCRQHITSWQSPNPYPIWTGDAWPA